MSSSNYFRRIGSKVCQFGIYRKAWASVGTPHTFIKQINLFIPVARASISHFGFTTVIAPKVLIINWLKLLHHRNFKAAFLAVCQIECFRLQITMSTFVGSLQFFFGHLFIRQWRLISGVVKPRQRLIKVAPTAAHGRLNWWSIDSYKFIPLIISIMDRLAFPTSQTSKLIYQHKFHIDSITSTYKVESMSTKLYCNLNLLFLYFVIGWPKMSNHEIYLNVAQIVS